MTSRPLKLFFIAGEASGDARAAEVVGELLRLAPDAEVLGLGGPRMAAAGMRLLRDMTVDMAIVGLVEVFKKAPKILAVRRQARAAIRSARPDALVLVDYPGFNLGLMAPYAAALGIPVIYYIAPQFWAWHRSRLQKLKRYCRLVLPIFPFEEGLLREAGIDARFTGNPLLDDLRPDLPRETVLPRFGLDPGAPVVGMLPGSRRREVAKHLSPMLEAARRLRARDPRLQFVAVRAATIAQDDLAEALRAAGVPVQVLDPPADGAALVEAHSLRAAFDFAWVKSGTSTLETALFLTPFVVVYKVSPLTAFIGRRVIRVPFMGMPNLVAGEEVAPELIQEDLTVDRLVFQALRILDDPERAERTRAKLRGVRERFGPPGSAARAAAVIFNCISSGGVAS